MATLNIPLTTLPLGSTDFGPVSFPDADTGVRLTIDRTVANGFNANPAVVMDIAIFQSNDGGVTWFGGGGTELTGGSHPGRFANSDNVWVSLSPGTSRRVRATVTVSGSSVAVQGTLVTG